MRKRAALLLILLPGCATSGQVVAGGAYVSSLLTLPSSNASNQSSNSTSAPTNASSGSTGVSVETSGAVPSTIVVGASALLLAVGGGITTTVYLGQSNAKAKADAEEFRRLHPPQVVPPTIPSDVPPQPPVLLTPPAEPTVPPSPPPISARQLDAMIMARAWLVANRLQLKQDLALGAGPAIDDLAGIAGIAPGHRAHFGQVLQQNRARLESSAAVSLEEAAAVMASVGELVMADAWLRADGEAAFGASREARSASLRREQ